MASNPVLLNPLGLGVVHLLSCPQVGEALSGLLSAEVQVPGCPISSVFEVCTSPGWTLLQLPYPPTTTFIAPQVDCPAGGPEWDFHLLAPSSPAGTACELRFVANPALCLKGGWSRTQASRTALTGPASPGPEALEDCFLFVGSVFAQDLDDLTVSH